jgi:hypothetical protein
VSSSPSPSHLLFSYPFYLFNLHLLSPLFCSFPFTLKHFPTPTLPFLYPSCMFTYFPYFYCILPPLLFVAPTVRRRNLRFPHILAISVFTGFPVCVKQLPYVGVSGFLPLHFSAKLLILGPSFWRHLLHLNAFYADLVIYMAI